MTVSSRIHVCILAVSAGLLLIFGCSSCTKRPGEILSEKKLVSLMADMELAEAYYQVSPNRSDMDNRDSLGRGVLEAHGVTREKLDTTLAWYGRNMDEYTELYAKVDKEIVSRRKKLLNIDTEGSADEADMLWKYGLNSLISDLGNTDALVVSIPDPELQNGDLLEWTLHVMNPVQLNGVLGVEYADGTSKATVDNFIGRNKLELKLQTDTGKTVKRIYGSIRVKDRKSLPLFTDSILLRKVAFDSIEYNHYRSVRKYGVPVKKLAPKPIKTDSIASDTISSIMPGTSTEPSASNVKMWNANGTPSTPNAPVKSVTAPVRKKPERRQQRAIR